MTGRRRLPIVPAVRPTSQHDGQGDRTMSRVKVTVTETWHHVRTYEVDVPEGMTGDALRDHAEDHGILMDSDERYLSATHEVEPVADTEPHTMTVRTGETVTVEELTRLLGPVDMIGD